MRRIAPSYLWTGSLFLIALLCYVGLIGIRVLYPIAHMEQLVAFADDYSLDPALVAAIVRCESRFRADAVSHRGAIGLMQIMPDTGAWIAQQLGALGFEIDLLYDANLNLQFGTWYLRHLLNRFGDRADALAAYNAGPRNVEQWQSGSGTIFPETAAYVVRVVRSTWIYRLYFRAPWLYRITPSLLL